MEWWVSINGHATLITYSALLCLLCLNVSIDNDNLLCSIIHVRLTGTYIVDLLDSTKQCFNRKTAYVIFW